MNEIIAYWGLFSIVPVFIVLFVLPAPLFFVLAMKVFKKESKYQSKSNLIVISAEDVNKL